MEWNDSIATGVEAIDNQHREIINHVNHVLGCCGREESRENVYQALDNLGSYTIEHFQYEEKIQKEKQYPEYGTHRREHDALVELLQGLLSQFENGEPYTAITWRANSDLSQRLWQHFSESDKAFTTYLQNAPCCENQDQPAVPETEAYPIQACEPALQETQYQAYQEASQETVESPVGQPVEQTMEQPVPQPAEQPPVEACSETVETPHTETEEHTQPAY